MDSKQTEAPFWLLKVGFEETGSTAGTENVVYGIWQKSVQKGRLDLGINGFDKYRYTYLLTVEPRAKVGNYSSIPSSLKPKQRYPYPHAPNNLIIRTY